MIKEKIADKRTPYKYTVIINNGLDCRLFKDIDVMCECMGLDKKILNKHFEKRISYTAFDFTAFKAQEETAIRNRGYHY